MRRTLFALFLPALTAVTAAGTARAEILVSAAASLSDVLPEIARSWEASGGEKLAFNFGASSALVSQIEAGAPVDLILTADEATMARLETSALLLPGSRRALLGNRLAVVVPSGSRLVVTGAADLVAPAVKRLAIADPTAVPAGRYARAWLEARGLWRALEKRVVPTLNVRAALAAVAAGEAEAGIVYLTDVAASPKIVLAFTVPEGESPPIVYPVAVIAASKRPEAARKLLDFLASPAARATFDRFGFAAPTP